MQGWRETVIETLRDIADTEAQRAAWVSGIGRPIPDPIELGCELFDDTNLGNRLSTGLVFSRECDELLRQLGRLFEASSLGGPPAAVLGSPEWREIVLLARAALDCVGAR
jgi:hypothetical protein